MNMFRHLCSLVRDKSDRMLLHLRAVMVQLQLKCSRLSVTCGCFVVKLVSALNIILSKYLLRHLCSLVREIGLNVTAPTCCDGSVTVKAFQIICDLCLFCLS